jgi:hypothetical protein
MTKRIRSKNKVDRRFGENLWGRAKSPLAGRSTSDRNQDKNVKVEHQPGAAGTRGSGLGASSGTSASSTTMPSTRSRK